MADFGTDFDDTWEVNERGDFKTVTGTDNAEQAVRNRLLTGQDELEWAYEDEPYGTESEDVIGETDMETACALIELYDELALLEDPRVEDIYDITVEMGGLHVAVEDITVKMIDEDNPSNIIIRREV